MFKYKNLTEVDSELPTAVSNVVKQANDDSTYCEPHAKRFSPSYHHDTHTSTVNDKTVASVKSETGLYLHSSVAASHDPAINSHLEQSRLHTVLQMITHRRSQKLHRLDKERTTSRLPQHLRNETNSASRIDKENEGSMNSLHSAQSSCCISSCSLSGIVIDDNFDSDSQKELLLHTTDEPSLHNAHRHCCTDNQHKKWRRKDGGLVSSLLKERNASFGSDSNINRHPVYWLMGQDYRLKGHEVDRISL